MNKYKLFYLNNYYAVIWLKFVYKKKYIPILQKKFTYKLKKVIFSWENLLKKDSWR